MADRTLPSSLLISVAGVGMFYGAALVPDQYRTVTKAVGGVLIVAGLVMSAQEIASFLGFGTPPEGEGSSTTLPPTTHGDPDDPGIVSARIISPSEGQTVDTPAFATSYAIQVELTSTRRTTEYHRVQLRGVTSFTLASNATTQGDLGVEKFIPGQPRIITYQMPSGTGDIFVLFPPSVSMSTLIDGQVSHTVTYQLT